MDGVTNMHIHTCTHMKTDDLKSLSTHREGKEK